MECACGCGKDLNPIDSRGRERKFLPGHNSYTHRHHRSRVYFTWTNMIARCTRPSCRRWEYYGGRGITVCKRWLVFENFLEDMGERPEGRTLDRKDVNGNYEPGNCRWATNAEQAANKRPRKDSKLAEVRVQE